MSSFLVSKEEVQRFCKDVAVSSMEGMDFVYETKPEIITKLLPPGFEPVNNYIRGALYEIADFTCGEPYMEGMFMVATKFRGRGGVYPFNLMVGGRSATDAFLHGRETCGYPKKIADFMEVRRVGNICTGKIIRRGATLLDITVDLGKAPAPEAATLMPDRVPGSVRTGCTLLHKYDLRMTDNGSCKFSNCEVNASIVDHTTISYEKGAADIKMQSSVMDPFGELEVVKPVGGSWFRDGYCPMKALISMGPVDTDETMPYLLSGRYDRGVFDYVSYHRNSI